MSIRPNPHIERLEACYHGGPDYAEMEALGISPADVIDFSVGSNPFSCPPGVKEALDEAVIDRYPDSECGRLRTALSHKLGIPTDNIIVGSGSTETIRLIAQTYLGPEDAALIPRPTFGEYETAARMVGADIVEYWSREEDDFAFKAAAIAEMIKSKRPKAAFICNPNNPSGSYMSREEVEQIISASEDTLIVLDEAYGAFTEGRWSPIELGHSENLITLFSMTKDYCIPGLRLGYALASPEIIRNLSKVRPPWNVNDPAQRAGVAALEESAHIKKAESRIRQAKRFLTSELAAMGFRVLPSKTNFFMMEVGDAAAFRSALIKHGLVVRNCASFGLPGYARIAVLTMPQCRRLAETIAELKRHGELPG